MDGATLAHHTQLTDWYARHQAPPVDPKPRGAKRAPLTPDKYESIGRWCTEVSRLFLKPPKKESPPLFRKCRYSDAMFPPNKSTARGHSAGSSARLWSGPGKRNSVRSAVLTGRAGVPSGSAGKGRQPVGGVARVGVGSGDESSTALAVKMAESEGHYAQERKVVHLHIQPEWKRKLSTGWTINRPMLYPKVPPPAPPDNLLVDIPDYLVRNEEKRMEVSPASSSKSKASAPGSVKPDVPSAADLCSDDSGSSKGPDLNNEYGVDCHPLDKGTQCEAVEEELGEEEEEEVGGKPVCEGEETASPRAQYKPVISDRSTSNDILNVLSVDDCKMMLRYRPVRIVGTHDSMILPPSKPHAPHPEKDGVSGDVIPEDNASVSTQNTPIRLSHGSARTTLSHNQVQSRVPAYKEMYETFRKRTPEDKVQRPSSAAVEKAFGILLDPEFQACLSSRRPLSGPPHLPRNPSRNGDHDHDHHDRSFAAPSSSSSCPPSAKFQQLNATLRQHMYYIVDSRWNCTKLKFQKSRSGYTRSAMKKGRMITSSPKPSWASEEELAED